MSRGARAAFMCSAVVLSLGPGTAYAVSTPAALEATDVAALDVPLPAGAVPALATSSPDGTRFVAAGRTTRRVATRKRPKPTPTPTPTPTATPSPSPTPTPTPTTVTPPPSTAPTLVWRDDFDGPAGSRVNPAWWTELSGGEGWGNQELQLYQSGGKNAAVDGQGNLVITARKESAGTCWYGPCQYTSARLTTAKKVTANSGRVEARLKTPIGKGVWPAFWMLGDNLDTAGYPQCGEADIMELVGDWPSEIWSSIHGPNYVMAGLTAPYRLPDGVTYHDDFHTFAMEWTSTGVQFSVDGHVYHTVNRADVGSGEWVFDKPMHVILNLAVGGKWPGDPAPTTQFPAQLVVDYVAMYR